MSLQSKINQWIRSAEGKQRLSEAVKELRSSGSTKTGGGSELITKEKADMLAEELRNTIISHATESLAGASRKSVIEDVESLSSSPACLDKSYYLVELSFGNDLSRQSLFRRFDGIDFVDPTGTGIDNIIALFNNGVEGAKTVHGYWAGHTIDNGPWQQAGYDPWVASVGDRPALRFMQQAIEDFKNKYAGIYDITVTLDAVYN